MDVGSVHAWLVDESGFCVGAFLSWSWTWSRLPWTSSRMEWSHHDFSMDWLTVVIELVLPFGICGAGLECASWSSFLGSTDPVRPSVAPSSRSGHGPLWRRGVVNCTRKCSDRVHVDRFDAPASLGNTQTRDTRLRCARSSCAYQVRAASIGSHPFGKACAEDDSAV